MTNDTIECIKVVKRDGNCLWSCLWPPSAGVMEGVVVGWGVVVGGKELKSLEKSSKRSNGLNELELLY